MYDFVGVMTLFFTGDI